jgi:hypothetical protein
MVWWISPILPRNTMPGLHLHAIGAHKSQPQRGRDMGVHGAGPAGDPRVHTIGARAMAPADSSRTLPRAKRYRNRTTDEPFSEDVLGNVMLLAHLWQKALQQVHNEVMDAVALMALLRSRQSMRCLGSRLLH